MAVPADHQQAEIITASTSVDTDNTKAAEAPSESFSQNAPLLQHLLLTSGSVL